MPRILVVDDSADARHLLRTILVHAGHEVAEAVNGAEALAYLHNEPADLVISDGLMPVMDGFRLCLELRRDPALSGLPFIFHTASFTQDDDVQLASAMGAEAYLLKPAEPREIIETVEKVLAHRSPDAREALVDQRLVSILDRYGGRIEHKLDQKVADLDRTRALRDSYRALLNHLPIHIITLDLEGDADFINAAVADFSGVTDPASVFGTAHPDDVEGAREFVASLRADSRPMQRTMRLRRADGEYHLFDMTARPYQSPDGAVLGFVLAATDITREEQQKELLLHAAEYDPLTDLPTRHVFDRRFDEILRNVGKGANCALLFIDSDDLKGVNDRFGFDVGDAAVANLARTIVDAVRPADMVARLCATEFVVLAENLGWDEAGVMSQRIRLAVANRALVPAAPEVRLGVNIALNVVPEIRPALTPTADSASAARPRDAEESLLTALLGEPELSFDPVYALNDGHLTRCSARYAYTLEERLISGDELALGAAKYGVARRIGSRIVEATLQQIRESGVACSVRLTLANVLDPTIFDRAVLAAELHAVDPGRLLFEISVCNAGGIRPPASWLQAAHRSPIGLIHVCSDLLTVDAESASLLGAVEVEVPAPALLDESGAPRPTVGALIHAWRDAGIAVTAAGVPDEAWLADLKALGVTHVSGAGVAQVERELARVPRTLRRKV